MYNGNAPRTLYEVFTTRNINYDLRQLKVLATTTP